MMGDPLGSSARVSSQKQNSAGVVGAQSGQYRATVKLSPGRDVTISDALMAANAPVSDRDLIGALVSIIFLVRLCCECFHVFVHQHAMNLRVKISTIFLSRRIVSAAMKED